MQLWLCSAAVLTARARLRVRVRAVRVRAVRMRVCACAYARARVCCARVKDARTPVLRGEKRAEEGWGPPVRETTTETYLYEVHMYMYTTGHIIVYRRIALNTHTMERHAHTYYVHVPCVLVRGT